MSKNSRPLRDFLVLKTLLGRSTENLKKVIAKK